MMAGAVADLPRIPFAARGTLPDCPGVYAVVRADGSVVYVGLSRVSLRKRWKQHPVMRAAVEEGGEFIAYSALDDIDAIGGTEKAWIREHQPPLNFHYVTAPLARAHERQRQRAAESTTSYAT